jgi:hypothetical protein
VRISLDDESSGKSAVMPQPESCQLPQIHAVDKREYLLAWKLLDKQEYDRDRTYSVHFGLMLSHSLCPVGLVLRQSSASTNVVPVDGSYPIVLWLIIEELVFREVVEETGLISEDKCIVADATSQHVFLATPQSGWQADAN